MDLAQLRMANIQRDMEWTKGGSIQLSASFRGNELAGEVGELCNMLKKLDRERLGLVGSRASVAEMAKEAADVLICLDLICMDLGVNLSDVTRAKFNETSAARGLETRL